MPSFGKYVGVGVFGQAPEVQGGWWHNTHYAERVFQARAYHHSLDATAAMLPDIKALGYSVVNLDWPVMAGPVNLYGGFGPKDYYHVEPLIGTDDDWVKFVEAAHALDMKVVSWFNPSYFWTGATAFKIAEIHVAAYGINGSYLPLDSPARWFRWSENCSLDEQVTKPKDENADSYYNHEGRWVYDPDAGGACYWSVFSDQPSGDLSIPEWQDEVKRIFKHWVGTGIDGFMLDAPYDYIGVGPPKADLNATLIREIIIDTVHSLRDGEVAVFGEEYSFREPDLARSLDGSIVGNWVVDGGLRSLDVAALIRAGSSEDLESMLEAVDALAEVGSVARTRPDFCQEYDEDIDQLAANVLQAAAIAMLGGYYEVIGTCQDDVGAGIGDFGDYEPWAGEAQIAPILNGMRSTPALRPGTPRSLLSVNSTGAYAALRGCEIDAGKCNQQQTAVVVLNFQNSPQTLQVDLQQFGQVPRVLTSLLTNEDVSSAIVSRDGVVGHILVTLPALGFGLYSLKMHSDLDDQTSIAIV